VAVFLVAVSTIAATYLAVTAARNRDQPDRHATDPPSDSIADTRLQQEFQAQLAKGKSIALQDEKGMLRLQSKRDLSGVSRLRAEDGLLRVEQAKGFTLIKTLTEPYCSSYEFRGELRHDACAGPTGGIGLIILDWERITPDVEEHCNLSMGFADLGPRVERGAGKHALVEVALTRRRGDLLFTSSMLPLPGPQLQRRPGEFREIVIRVTPAQIDMTLDGHLLRSIDRSTVQARAKETLFTEIVSGRFPEGSKAPAQLKELNREARELYLRECPGVYVWNSSASIRNLQIIPVP
jgi:hypothetical protein